MLGGIPWVTQLGSRSRRCHSCEAPTLGQCHVWLSARSPSYSLCPAGTPGLTGTPRATEGYAPGLPSCSSGNAGAVAAVGCFHGAAAHICGLPSTLAGSPPRPGWHAQGPGWAAGLMPRASHRGRRPQTLDASLEHELGQERPLQPLLRGACQPAHP